MCRHHLSQVCSPCSVFFSGYHMCSHVGILKLLTDVARKFLWPLQRHAIFPLYYISTEIYSEQTHQMQIVRSLMRSNLTGHTIFLTSEEYRIINQPDTILFHKWENSYRFFPPLGAIMRNNWEWMLATFPAFPESWLGDINSVEQLIEGQENENTWRKLSRMLHFLTLRNESSCYRRNSAEGSEFATSLQFVLCG